MLPKVTVMHILAFIFKNKLKNLLITKEKQKGIFFAIEKVERRLYGELPCLRRKYERYGRRNRIHF
jgi:hypothetical protein